MLREEALIICALKMMIFSSMKKKSVITLDYIIELMNTLIFRFINLITLISLFIKFSTLRSYYINNVLLM